MQNFVIDLSTNTGGSDDTMGFILSSIENKNANAYHIDAKTKYRMKDTFYADKNLDGVIDEKDEEVKYDFNYAIMTSRVSYSNGNALPARASEAGIPTLGERSGGGGCSLSFFGLPGASNKYCISGTYSLTYSNYESIDPGVPADYEMLEINDDGTIKSADFYDPTKLVATMNQHYAKKDIASCTVTGIEAKTYNGEEQTQAITVKDGQAILAEGADYTVSYRDNVNAGTATATIEGKGAYAGSVDKAFKIKKAENPMTVKGKTVTASASKKSTFKKAQAFKVSDAEGKVTFRKDKGNSKITVGKTGKATVKKGLKAGKAYKVKVKVTAAGNENYKKATKAATVKVRVK